MNENEVMELICTLDGYCYTEKMIEKLEQQLDLLKSNRKEERQKIEQKAQDIFRKMQNQNKK